MNGSIEYYNSNAENYCNNTLNVDMSKIYHSFLQHLPPGALILDAGCGSGRDSLHFLNQGYRVEAFDGSSEMARRSSELTGLQVEYCTFEQFHSRKQFDAIWDCASLLPVEKEKRRDNKLPGRAIESSEVTLTSPLSVLTGTMKKLTLAILWKIASFINIKKSGNSLTKNILIYAIAQKGK